MTLRLAITVVVPVLSVGLWGSAATARSTTTEPVRVGVQVKMPDGVGKAQTIKVCNDCHAVEAHLLPARSRPEWTKMLNEMIAKGASIGDDEWDPVVSYLSGNFGKKIAINTATVEEIQYLLEIPAPQAEAIVKYRTESGKFKAVADLLKVPGVDTARIAAETSNFDFGTLAGSTR